jgi:hypothetical protein
MKGGEGSFFWICEIREYKPDRSVICRQLDNPDELARSACWEAIRKGRDELRYLSTVKNLIEKATGEKERSLKEGRLFFAYQCSAYNWTPMIKPFALFIPPLLNLSPK